MPVAYLHCRKRTEIQKRIAECEDDFSDAKAFQAEGRKETEQSAVHHAAHSQCGTFDKHLDVRMQGYLCQDIGRLRAECNDR